MATIYYERLQGKLNILADAVQYDVSSSFGRPVKIKAVRLVMTKNQVFASALLEILKWKQVLPNAEHLQKRG